MSVPAGEPASTVTRPTGGGLIAVPWHPILFAAWVIVGIWLDAAVSPFAAVRALVVAVLIASLLCGVGWAVTRSATVGGLLATGIIVAIWIRLPIEGLSSIAGRMGVVIGAIWALLVLAALVLVARRIRGRWSVDGATAWLNRATGLLLVATLLFGLVGGRMWSLVPDLDQGAPLTALATRESRPSPLPDIYAIVLDGYPRADALEYAFDFDNSEFLEALRERGFSIADRSHSDYLWTHVSLPSALNMAYVEQVPALRSFMEGRSPRQPTLRRAMADAAVFDLARGLGYTTVAVASGFEEVALRQADIYVDGGQLNEFEISVLTGTFAADLLRPLWPDFGSGQQRSRIRYDLEVLPQVAEASSRGPLFVFDHVPAPHQPTVFGAGGSPLANPLKPNWFADSPLERGEDPASFRARYRDQLPALNDLVITAVDGIISASDEPPVILIFADHGSASAVDWNATQPDEADPARLLERTAAFFAAYTPGRSDVFPDDISPVDIFRLLADAYWGTEYGRATPPENGGQISPVDASAFDR
jgi:hypothetical protein